MARPESTPASFGDTPALFFPPGFQRNSYLVGCCRLSNAAYYQHGCFYDDDEGFGAESDGVGGPLPQPLTQSTANQPFRLINTTVGASRSVNEDEAPSLLTSQPHGHFLQAHPSTSWPQHVWEVHNLLVDLHLGQGIKTHHAGAILRMLSWGVERCTGFMHQPIILSTPQHSQSATPQITPPQIRMGFPDWGAARSHMKNRRLFAGLVAFASDTNRLEAFWSPIVWDRRLGLLHVYDVGPDKSSRRLRIAEASAAWANVLEHLGFAGGFGVHSPPLTSVSSNLTATGPISVQVLHHVLHEKVGVPCRDLLDALPGLEGMDRVVHLGKDGWALRPKPSPLRHRDWVGTSQGIDAAKKACQLLVGTIGCQELGPLTRPSSRLAFFKANFPPFKEQNL